MFCDDVQTYLDRRAADMTPHSSMRGERLPIPIRARRTKFPKSNSKLNPAGFFLDLFHNSNPGP